MLVAAMFLSRNLCRLALNRVNVVAVAFGMEGPKICLTRVDHVLSHDDSTLPNMRACAQGRSRGLAPCAWCLGWPSAPLGNYIALLAYDGDAAMWKIFKYN